MNFYSDSKEWQYLFRNAVDWDSIIPLYYPTFPTVDGFNNKEEIISFLEELLTNTGKWTAETLAPRARQLDKMGAGKLVNGATVPSEVLQATYNEARDMDLFGMHIDPKHGGIGAPITAGMAAFAQVSRACISTSTQLGFFSTIAEMIDRFCSKEVGDELIPRIKALEISGCMCLTEPDAGSDVGSLRTSAEKQSDGKYLLNGTKCFITNAGGGLAFILARVKGAPKGLDGISMFFAREWLEDPKSGKKVHNYKIAKIEEKMGMHGSFTCEMVYDNTVAELIGNENEGFKIMLHLMNEARISVGLQSIGGIEASVSYARQYGESRKQFGKPLIELPLYRRNLQDWETEQDGFRAMMMDTISSFDIFQRLDLKKRHTGDLTENETKLFKKASRIVRRRTPLVKYMGTEAYTSLSTKAIQALGGYGYMQEYDAERFHRDSFGPLLYEGTSQVQALMAMKDFVKDMMKNPSNFLQSIVSVNPIAAMMSETEYDRSVAHIQYEFRKNIAGLILRCFKPELAVTEKGFMDTLAQINGVFKKEYWQEADRFDKLMVHAETLCQALSYKETLKVLGRHAAKNKERGELFNRYYNLVTPRLAGIYADWKRSNS